MKFKMNEKIDLLLLFFALSLISNCIAFDPAQGLKDVVYSRLGDEYSVPSKSVEITGDYKMMLDDPTKVILTKSNNKNIFNFQINMR